MLAGCKTTESVATPIAPDVHNRVEDNNSVIYRHDTTYIDRWHMVYFHKDTVFVHDSIFQYVGEKEHIHDTVSVSTTDTIHSIQYLEKQPTKSDIFWKRSGIALWVILGALLLGVIIGVIIKFAK